MNDALRPELPLLGRTFFRARPLILPVAFLLLVIVLLVRLPAPVLDVLLALNMALAAVVLLTTISMPRPLEFTVFPALLLATTLFRLVLNIASTRLILSAEAPTPETATGMAGNVIESFASFVGGSSLVVGAIIFAILVIVQFVVITRGAGRMSEVAARFTLDALPGKQMAIDADLAAGFIDDVEAHGRRDVINQEADFYGAMDGASRFVRGDAIAGLIIIVVNIVGGFVIGVFEKGWTLGESLEVFTRLTIGDGLVTQVPSFLIAIASGMVVARTGDHRTISEQIPAQLTSQPAVLFLIAALLVVLSATPLPWLPLLGTAGALTVVGLAVGRHRDQEAAEATAEERPAPVESPAPAAGEPPVESLLAVDLLELEIGYGLVPLVVPSAESPGGALLDRIGSMRRELAQELGVVVPSIRIRDTAACETNDYRVKLRGVVIGAGIVQPGRLLALDAGATTGPIDGRRVLEPAFGLEGWWIDPSARAEAEAMNYTIVDATSVVVTHLAEIVRHHADELITREEVSRLLEQLAQTAPKLVEETVPALVKPGDVQRILQNLLREGVPVRDLETILEALGDWSSHTHDHDLLTEYARHALRRTICDLYADRDVAGHSVLHCVTLHPALEQAVGAAVERSAVGTTIRLAPGLDRRIADAVELALAPLVESGRPRVVLTAPAVRSPVRTILEPHLPGIGVMSFNELVRDVDVRSAGLVHLPHEVEIASSGVANPA